MGPAISRREKCSEKVQSSSLDDEISDRTAEEALTAKKLVLLQKCNALIEVTEHFGSAYEEVLRALALANQQSVKTLQDQIFRLKETIPHLEKKRIKRFKLVGTLSDMHKQANKIKLNPEMARKKD